MYTYLYFYLFIHLFIYLYVNVLYRVCWADGTSSVARRAELGQLLRSGHELAVLRGLPRRSRPLRCFASLPRPIPHNGIRCTGIRASRSLLTSSHRGRRSVHWRRLPRDAPVGAGFGEALPATTTRAAPSNHFA